jgi:hypothetical protein
MHMMVGPLKLKGFIRTIPSNWEEKQVCIDIEVIDAMLDYNILLGLRLMYAMKVVSSLVFHKMIFPHKEKLITINQLTYHDPQSQLHLDTCVSLL